MFGFRGAVRPLSRVLALLMAPILVITIPHAAEASASYGPAATANFSYGSNVAGYSAGDGFSCSVTGYWTTETPAGPGNPPPVSYIPAKLNCSTEWNISSLAGVVINAAGSGCSYSSPVSPQLDGTSGNWDTTLTGSGTCVVTQLCYSAPTDWHTGSPRTITGCVPWTLGAPPNVAQPDGSCASGAVTVSAPVKQPKVMTFNGSSTTSYTAKVPVDFNVTVDAAHAGAWKAYVLMSPYTAATNYGDNGVITFQSSGPINGGLGVNAAVAFPTLSAGASTLVRLTPAVSANVSASYSGGPPVNPNPPENTTIIGAGIYWDAPTSPSSGARNAFPYVAGNAGLAGVTDPSRCSWYWGQKVYNEPDAAQVGIDNPAGQLIDSAAVPNTTPPSTTTPTPPSDPESTCSSFSWTDPTTWAGAGICALVAVMKRVLGVMSDLLAFFGHLVSDLVAALNTLFSTLFEPSPGFMDSKSSTLHDDVTSSNYQDWSDAFDGINGALPSGGTSGGLTRSDGSSVTQPTGGGGSLPGLPHGNGCHGPGVSWSEFTRLGLPSTMYPIDACTGTVATVAQGCKLFLTGMIGIAALVKIVQMIMVGLGLGKNINALSFDWKDAMQNRKWD